MTGNHSNPQVARTTATSRPPACGARGPNGGSGNHRVYYIRKLGDVTKTSWIPSPIKWAFFFFFSCLGASNEMKRGKNLTVPGKCWFPGGGSRHPVPAPSGQHVRPQGDPAQRGFCPHSSHQPGGTTVEFLLQTTAPREPCRGPQRLWGAGGGWGGEPRPPSPFQVSEASAFSRCSRVTCPVTAF